MSEEGLNPALEFIDALRKRVNTISFPFGRKVFLMTDTDVPPRKVCAFFKTQMDTFVREWEDEQKSEVESVASGE